MLAHTYGSKDQPLLTHLHDTRYIGKRYGEALHLSSVCAFVCLLHDVGKANDEFQNYLRHETAFGPEHSVYGAIIATELIEDTTLSKDSWYYTYLSNLCGNTILSHHNKLGAYDYTGDDGDIYLSKLNKTVDPQIMGQVEKWVKQSHVIDEAKELILNSISELNIIGQEKLVKYAYFYQRFIQSVLIDADHYDTALGGYNSNAVQKVEEYNSWRSNKLNEFSKNIETNVSSLTADTPIDWIRSKVSQEAVDNAKKPAGVHELVLPTGAGKTLAGIRYALKKTQKASLKRVVYVAPFLSVVEQTAKTYREFLGGDETSVLEYHSSITISPRNPKYYYASDSWGAPVIATSQVAYFNAIFGKGSKNIRHFHSLIQSVMICDEIQSVPIKLTAMHNLWVNFIHEATTTEFVLSTGTEPVFGETKEPMKIDGPLVEHNGAIEQLMRRVNVVDDTNKTMGLDELCDYVMSRSKGKSMLVILNTKKGVQALFNALPYANKYSISTSMCAEHRDDVLSQINMNLNTNPIVVATSAIEAGVDISFSAGIRALTGMDSIVQSFGRTNRNGEAERTTDYIISVDNAVDNLWGLPEVFHRGLITKALLRKYNPNDIFSSAVLHEYYRSVYKSADKAGETEYPQEEQGLSTLYQATTGSSKYTPLSWEKNHGRQVMFTAPQTVAENMNVIATDTTTVIVPYKKGKEIIEKLQGSCSQEEVSALLKQAQRYSISVYDTNNVVEDSNGFFYLPIDKYGEYGFVS